MKNNQTKNKLLQSAAKEFAKNGFYGATTRDIANKASTNISSIVYYFGGKKGIYAAVLENIVETIKESTIDLVNQYDICLENDDSIEANLLLNHFIKRFLHLLCSDKISKDLKTLFFTEYWKPTEDFSILYNGAILPQHTMFAELLSLASKHKISIQDAHLFTFPIFAQLFVFASRKKAICEIMEWQKYEDNEKNKLLSYILNQVDFLIKSN